MTMECFGDERSYPRCYSHNGRWGARIPSAPGQSACSTPVSASRLLGHFTVPENQVELFIWGQ